MNKNYNDQVDEIVEALSSLITREGYKVLYIDPYWVYTSLLEEKCDKEASIIILCALTGGVGKTSKKKEVIEKEIKNLPFNDDAVSFVFSVFTSLYSSRQRKEMKRVERAGLEEFLSREWTVMIFLQAEWVDKYNTSINYSFDYSITFSVCDRDKVEKEMEKEIRNNPFIKAEDILEKYRSELQRSVNSDFENYVTADDYYEPNIDDYDSESGDGAIEKYLESHGMEFLESEYSYSDDSPW